MTRPLPRSCGASPPATRRALGLVEEAAGDSTASESLLVEAYGRQRTHLGIDHPDTRETVWDLVKLYDAWGKPEKAAQYDGAGR